MDLLFWTESPGFDQSLLIYGRYEPWLVLLSVGIAIFASTMGLQAAAQVGRIGSPGLQKLMLSAGSLALGCGVWAMHFVGMLAFDLCAEVRYHWSWTMLSMVPSVAASWVALRLLSRPQLGARELLVGGVLVGAGIGAMHYMGMAAMRMAPMLRYDPWMFALSVVVAVGLAMLALWMRFGVDRWGPRGAQAAARSLLSGSVMGMAIAGMHYTGMAAARFIGTADRAPGQNLDEALPMALGITLITLMTSGAVAAATGLMRYRHLLQKVQAGNAQLKAMADTSIDGLVVINDTGTIVEFNNGAERIFMREASHMLGQHIGSIMIEPFRTHALKDFKALAAKTRFGVPIRTEAPRPDGSKLPIRLVMGHAQTERPLYVAFVHDTSASDHMEQALRHSEQQFRSLIGNIPGISYRCEPVKGWPMVFVSEAVERFTGYTVDDFMGTPPKIRFIDLVKPEDAVSISEHVMDSVRMDQPYILEFEMRHRDGSWRWMWGNGRGVRDDKGQLRWVDGVMLDITARRQIEEDLRHAKLRAEDAAAARTAFLANMSHEIRTPMNAIIGFTELVLGAPLADEPKRHLETVHRSAKSLLLLLNDILDNAKLERSAVQLEQIAFSLPELLSQLSEEHSLAARRKGLALSWHIDPSVGEWATGDPHRLRQVLSNLLGNAVKFTDHGSVSVHLRRQGDDLLGEVKDTGIGIPAHKIATIFDPYTQADASMSRRFGGTGLGTTICRQLIELMGGRIWIDSVEGQGSSFHFKVPLPPAQACDLSSDSDERIQLPPMRILVADDVPENVQLLQVLLGRQGHTVDTACNGREAVERHAEGGPYDLILMDVQMPEMDGLSASKAIRAHEQAHHMARSPMIALTASVFQEDRHAALDVGMNGFATKPIDPIALVQEIARVTGKGTVVVDVPAATGSAAATPATLAWPRGSERLIDPQVGLQRWGDEAAWIAALQQFAQRKAELTTPEQAQAPANAEAAATMAHRIRGAAANLGLLAVQREAQRVEDAAQRNDDLALQSTWRALRTALSDTLALVQQLHPDVQSEVTDRQPQSPALDHATVNELISQIDRLIDAFGRGEQPDTLLRQLARNEAQALPSAELQALMQAVDDFDFDAASACATRLRKHLTPEALDAAL